MKRIADWLSHWGNLQELQGIMASGLCLDSRRVKPGDVFFALPGTRTDGREYIAQALDAGASAVLTEGRECAVEILWQAGRPIIHVGQLSQQVSALAARWYGVDDWWPHFIGVTGTNGKSSTVHYLAQLARHARLTCGTLGTLGYGAGTTLTPLQHTTPDALQTMAVLGELRAAQCDWVVMEASSHALHQHRVRAVPFRTAVLTNISHDHLDYHGTMAAYIQAKARLFAMPSLRTAVVNAQDAASDALLQHCHDDVEIYRYAMDPDSADERSVVARNCQGHADGWSFRLESPWGQADVQIPLMGQFNVANVLAAVTVWLAETGDWQTVIETLPRLVAVPGRVQQFEHEDCRWVVDFAHTPDAVAAVLQALRPHAKGQLWCVFGCGGDRDRAKRPLMAAAAERYADRVVVTADNPRGEALADIFADIAPGFDAPDRIQWQPDRADALAWVAQRLAPGDVVAVVGKGHERVQIIGDETLPYSDLDQVQRLTGGIL